MNNEQFRGILVQARQIADASSPVGRFTVLGDTTELSACTPPEVSNRPHKSSQNTAHTHTLTENYSQLPVKVPRPPSPSIVLIEGLIWSVGALSSRPIKSIRVDCTLQSSLLLIEERRAPLQSCCLVS